MISERFQLPCRKVSVEIGCRSPPRRPAASVADGAGVRAGRAAVGAGSNGPVVPGRGGGADRRAARRYRSAKRPDLRDEFRRIADLEVASGSCAAVSGSRVAVPGSGRRIQAQRRIADRDPCPHMRHMSHRSLTKPTSLGCREVTPT